jgi:hypothetical protein
MFKFIAIVNVPGYLPESDPLAFDSAREAWEYLVTEEQDRNEDVAWVPDNEEDPEGPASLAPYVLSMEAKAREDRTGTVYGPTLAYSVDYAEWEEED